MSSPRARAGFDIPRPYSFKDNNITYEFGFDKHLMFYVLMTEIEMRDSKETYVHDFIRLTSATIESSWLFDKQHRWLSENFRQYLLKFIKLIVFT